MNSHYPGSRFLYHKANILSGVLAVVFLLMCTFVLTLQASHFLSSSAQKTAQVHQQLVGEIIEAHLLRLARTGVSLSSIAQNDSLLTQQLERFPKLAGIRILNAEQELLVGIGQHPNETSVHNLITFAGAPMATVVLTMHPFVHWPTFALWLAGLLPLILVFSWLCVQACRYSLALGVHYRTHFLRAGFDSILQGNFLGRFTTGVRKEFDLRPQWLTGLMRELQELYERLCRLQTSLRQAEPDPQRRAELDAIMLSAVGKNRFTDTVTRWPLPFPFSAQVRWLFCLTAFGVGLLLSSMAFSTGVTIWLTFPLLMMATALGAWVTHIGLNRLTLKQKGKEQHYDKWCRRSIAVLCTSALLALPASYFYLHWHICAMIALLCGAGQYLLCYAVILTRCAHQERLASQDIHIRALILEMLGVLAVGLLFALWLEWLGWSQYMPWFALLALMMFFTARYLLRGWQSTDNIWHADSSEESIPSSRMLSLKTLVPIVVMLSVLLLSAVFGLLLMQREGQTLARYHDSLIQNQKVLWQAVEKDAKTMMQAQLNEIMLNPAWQQVQQNHNLAQQVVYLKTWAQKNPDTRLDYFDAHGQIVYSSVNILRPVPIVDAKWLRKAAQKTGSTHRVFGLSAALGNHFFWVLSQGIADPQGNRVLVIGKNVAQNLPGLAKKLNSESIQAANMEIPSYVMTARGGMSLGLGYFGLDETSHIPNIRSPKVLHLNPESGERYLLLPNPLKDIHGKRIGILMTVRDITLEYAQERRELMFLILGSVLAALLLAGGLFLYLRSSLRLLDRSLLVLNALAKGDTQVALDESDETYGDEAGRVARAVSAVRFEVLNFEMLRDIRVRMRDQQTRLIRDRLTGLAQGLKGKPKQEILSALATARDGDVDNRLAHLAGVLGRMSTMVTTQQPNLVGVLKDLQSTTQKDMLVNFAQELDVARNLQLSILPRKAPNTKAVELSALLVPAQAVGGDFYDYFLLDAQHLAVVVADVSGKGVPGAFFMAISRTLLKKNALLSRDPAYIIDKLNVELYKENEENMFVTLFFGILNLTSGELNYVNAGHNPPILCRNDGSTVLLPYGENLPLAVTKTTCYKKQQAQMYSGETLVMYTDGVTEAHDGRDHFFGMDALRALLTDKHFQTAASIPQRVLKAVREFEETSAQSDDIACVALRFKGQAQLKNKLGPVNPI